MKKDIIGKSYELTAGNELVPINREMAITYIEKLEQEIEQLKAKLQAVENNRRLTELWASGEVEN